jgi:type IV fimbrial biogenesis protein FimT
MKFAFMLRVMLRYSALNTTIRSKAGFSLVELMMVIAVFIILSAIAVPSSTKWLANYRLKVGASDVYAALQLARSSALKENADVVVWFDVNNDTYRLYEDTDGDRNQDAGEKTIKDGTIQDSVDMYNTNFSSWANQTYFNSRGIAEGGWGYVYLKSAADKYKRITLWTTGNLKIESSSDGSSWS